MVSASKVPFRVFFQTPILLFTFSISLLSSTIFLVYALISATSVWVSFLFLSGFLVWTLYEYLLIRFFLHRISENTFPFNFSRFHHWHHAEPSNPRYLVIHPGILLISIFLIGLIGFVVLPFSIMPVLSGFLFGYSLFIVLHYIQHYANSQQGDFLFSLSKNHFLHHSNYCEKAFGVTTKFWDWVFQTNPPCHLLLEVNPLTLKNGKSLSLIEVLDPVHEKAFLEVPEVIYQNNPFWIGPLHSDIQNIFDPNFNPYYKHGTTRRWIVVNQHQDVLGRIAAFIDFTRMYESGKKIGCIGFFECVEDEEVAKCLLDVAMKWLGDYYQIDAVDGPVNFGENDKYWGLLLDGFESSSYGMNYNPPYYKDFLEKYGFEKQYEQLTNQVDLKNSLPERFSKISERVCRNKRYRFVHFSYKQKDKLVKDFVYIYNEAWASFKNFRPISEAYIKTSLLQLKPVLVESFVWFVYVDEKPAGLLVGLPDLNEALKNIGGKFTLLSKIKFLLFKYFKGFTKVRVVIMGVIPEFQRLGLESALIYNAFKAGMEKPNFKYVQLAWVGDFNQKMIAIHQAMGAVPEMRHATYRKFLN
jgi:hypothetical protein